MPNQPRNKKELDLEHEKEKLKKLVAECEGFSQPTNNLPITQSRKSSLAGMEQLVPTEAKEKSNSHNNLDAELNGLQIDLAQKSDETTVRKLIKFIIDHKTKLTTFKSKSLADALHQVIHYDITRRINPDENVHPLPSVQFLKVVKEVSCLRCIFSLQLSRWKSITHAASSKTTANAKDLNREVVSAILPELLEVAPYMQLHAAIKMVTNTLETMQEKHPLNILKQI